MGAGVIAFADVATSNTRPAAAINLIIGVLQGPSPTADQKLRRVFSQDKQRMLKLFEW
jgi:hypothetical protein